MDFVSCHPSGNLDSEGVLIFKIKKKPVFPALIDLKVPPIELTL